MTMKLVKRAGIGNTPKGVFIDSYPVTNVINERSLLYHFN
jgi:hypothetical protein